MRKIVPVSCSRQAVLPTDTVSFVEIPLPKDKVLRVYWTGCFYPTDFRQPHNTYDCITVELCGPNETKISQRRIEVPPFDECVVDIGHGFGLLAIGSVPLRIRPDCTRCQAWLVLPITPAASFPPRNVAKSAA